VGDCSWRGNILFEDEMRKEERAATQKTTETGRAHSMKTRQAFDIGLRRIDAAVTGIVRGRQVSR